MKNCCILHGRVFVMRYLFHYNYSETLNGLTMLVVKYILNRGTSLSISYRSHQIHSQLIFMVLNWWCNLVPSVRINLIMTLIIIMGVLYEPHCDKTCCQDF